MPRYLIVAGVDFGTSFTKVVLRDNNTPGSKAVVVRFPKHSDRLLPSLVGIQEDNLTPPTFSAGGVQVPYLKMLAAHVARRKTLERTPVRIPAALGALRHLRTDTALVRELLAFYFAHVIAATEDFIRTRSPWRDFDFAPGSKTDFLIFQLAVPTGLLDDKGKSEKLFRDAFIAGYELRRKIGAAMAGAMPHTVWSKNVDQVLNADRNELNSRFQWQCLLYPEVAAAVQTVFRSPNARDGLYITMDVGAGTVDLNAFRRFTGNKTERLLDYYSAIVCPLGIQNLKDPHGAVQQQSEDELMKKLRQSLLILYQRAARYQPNHGSIRGRRTWDGATFFVFGGGAHHYAYQENFYDGLQDAGIHEPQLYYLPASRDIVCPPESEFGRFAVAYGLSFFRPSLDKVSLPHELKPFAQLYPEIASKPPRQYGFNWDD